MPVFLPASQVDIRRPGEIGDYIGRKIRAEILKIDLSRVSVKATTTEGLGFTGRREGIAAQAIATVKL